MRSFVLPLLLTTACLAGPTQVTLTTQDGNQLIGTIEVTSFKIDSSLGTVEVKIENVTAIKVEKDGTAQVGLRDYSVLKGKLSLASWEITTSMGKFNPKTADIAMIVFPAVYAGQAPGQPGPPQPGQPQLWQQPPAQAPKPPPEPKPDLQPQKTLGSTASFAGLLASTDGKKLFALDASASLLLIIDSDTFEAPAEVPLHGNETAMSISIDGKTLLAGGKQTVTVVDLAAQKVTRSFQIEKQLTDLWAGDGQMVYGTTGNELLQISVQKQGITATMQRSGGILRPRMDGKKLYSSDGAFVFADAKSMPVFCPYRYSTLGYGGNLDLHISPDGRYAVGSSGQVYRLGRSALADMMPLGRAEPNGACVFLPNAKRALVFTPAGFVKAYTLGTFELEKSYSIGMTVSLAVADEAKGALYLFGAPAQANGGGYNPYPRSLPVGRLYRFELPK